MADFLEKGISDRISQGQIVWVLYVTPKELLREIEHSFSCRGGIVTAGASVTLASAETLHFGCFSKELDES